MGDGKGTCCFGEETYRPREWGGGILAGAMWVVMEGGATSRATWAKGGSRWLECGNTSLPPYKPLRSTYHVFGLGEPGKNITVPAQTGRFWSRLPMWSFVGNKLCVLVFSSVTWGR